MTWMELKQKKREKKKTQMGVAELSERRVSKGTEAVKGPNALISKKKKLCQKDQAGFSVKPRK